MTRTTRRKTPAEEAKILSNKSEEFLKWLKKYVFSPSVPATKNKLVNLDDIVTLRIASTNRRTAITNGRYWRIHSSRQIETRNVLKYTDVLKGGKSLLKSSYNYTDKKVFYVSCILPGETLKAHKTRHLELLKAKISKREAVLKTNEIVLKDSSIKKAEAELIAAKKTRTTANRILNKHMLAFVESLKQQVGSDSLDDVWKSQVAARLLIEDARKELNAAGAVVLAKKQELILLKRALKKPVRGLVKNPQAMNL